MYSNYIVFVNLLLLVVGGYSETQIFKCGNKDIPTPVKLEVSNCDVSPCLFYRGENAQATITFDVPFDIEEMSVKIVAKVPGLFTPITYPLKDAEVCPHLLTGFCPVEEGERVTYQVEVPVLKLFPKLKVEFELSIENEDKDAVVCFNLPIQILDRK